MNRRAFVHTLGFGALGKLAVLDAPRAFARSASETNDGPDVRVPAITPIRIANNENPYGPGPGALQAIARVVAKANRYPGSLADDLVSTIAARHDVPPERILLSGGSGDIMRAAVYACTSQTRALVTARPSYEAPMRSAQHIGSPVARVPLTRAFGVDLGAMAARAVGAGLVYICNPNNPTSTVVAAEDLDTMIERVVKTSPQTRILIDEAYIDYAHLPEVDTAIPLVAKHPQLIVTRTFSKIHGMAGMRVGYAVAQPETLARIAALHSRSSLSSVSLAAATASLEDTVNASTVAEMNRAVRTFTVKAFTAMGYQVAPAEANFIFVNIRRDAHAFEQACSLKGVYVGRAFPPMSTWSRISVGTLEEMQVAMAVFRDVLATASREPVRPPRAGTA